LALAPLCLCAALSHLPAYSGGRMCDNKPSIPHSTWRCRHNRRKQNGVDSICINRLAAAAVTRVERFLLLHLLAFMCAYDVRINRRRRLLATYIYHWTAPNHWRRRQWATAAVACLAERNAHADNTPCRRRAGATKAAPPLSTRLPHRRTLRGGRTAITGSPLPLPGHLTLTTSMLLTCLVTFKFLPSATRPKLLDRTVWHDAHQEHCDMPSPRTCLAVSHGGTSAACLPCYRLPRFAYHLTPFPDLLSYFLPSPQQTNAMAGTPHGVPPPAYDGDTMPAAGVPHTHHAGTAVGYLHHTPWTYFARMRDIATGKPCLPRRLNMTVGAYCALR